MRIDVHNHVILESALELFRRDASFGFTVGADGWASPHHGRLELWKSLYDPAAKVAELEKNGLDAAVVSPNPLVYYYDVPLEMGEQICEAMNRGMADFCRFDTRRLRWMAQVPLQSPQHAAQALEAEAGNGCSGVEIGSTVEGRQLDDEFFEPFWAAAERLEMPVFLHPSYNEDLPSIEPWYLHNVIGLPLLTTISVERLICAGTLDRHPRLKIVLAHAGGYFPWQAGRLRHARSTQPELEGTPIDPWSYLGQLVFDTITHDLRALTYLVDRVGEENVLIGTDLPTGMAALHPIDKLVDAVGETSALRIAEDNPARLFGFNLR